MDKSCIVTTSPAGKLMVFILSGFSRCFRGGATSELVSAGYTNLASFVLRKEPTFAEDGSFAVVINGDEAAIVRHPPEGADWTHIVSGNKKTNLTHDL